MQRVILIFLLAIIGFTHLNGVEAVLGSRAFCNPETGKMIKKHVNDEEREKENRTEEKAEEQEKLLSRDCQPVNNSKLSSKDKFQCFNTKINIHPFCDDEIQPPKAA